MFEELERVDSGMGGGFLIRPKRTRVRYGPQYPKGLLILTFPSPVATHGTARAGPFTNFRASARGSHATSVAVEERSAASAVSPC